MDLHRPWSEYDYVAFDTETSGAYPLDSEVVEFGAVKWSASKNQFVDEFQTLLKPSKPMSDFIIKIHGITNQMVENAPLMKDKISEIKNFFSGSILVAHHAPFDMGFMALDFEKYLNLIPEEPVLCTSLLARKLIQGTTNHKLQTLVKELNLTQPDGHKAHRALDDAKSCLQVLQQCFQRVGPDKSLSEVAKVMNGFLEWKNFKLLSEKSELFTNLIEFIRSKKDFRFIYLKDHTAQSKIPRVMTPLGLVRNPEGDYVVGICHNDGAQKRFYLNKIRLPDPNPEGS